MAKKLLIFSVILFFLFGLMAFARVDDAVTKPGEKTRESAQLERQRYVHPRISNIALPGSQNVPIEEFDEATFVDPEGDVIPISVERARKPALTKKHGYLYPGSSEIVPLEKAKDALPHGWLFNYDDESTEYYLSGGTAGDHWGIWFQSPQAACSLYAVEFIFHAPQGGGTINLDVMAAGTVSPDTIVNADSIAVDAVFGANLMGEEEYFELQIQALSDWERFIFPAWDYDIDVGRDIFWIHWEKTGDAPMLLADSDNPGDYLRTWSYEPVQDGDEKWSHYGVSVGIEAMVRCEVVFYEDPPPTVAAKQMNDTYRTDIITLTASANDNALDPALQGIASGELIYSLNGGDLDTIAATVTGDNTVGWTLSAEVPAGISGDEYEYYFGAVDLAGLSGRSFPALSFEITEPAYPDADLLIVADRATDDQANLDLYCTVADANGLVYEFWDVGEHNGIDASVVGFGPTNIIVYGWGTTTVPCTTETDPGYGNILDNGGNLLLVDQDWFYGHGLPAIPVFEAGDFAYDYFGIVGGTNDPAVDNVSTADTVFYGQDVTSMDSPFTQALGGLTINHNIYGTTNWGDYFDASNATVVFKGAVDGNTYGSVKVGTNFKAAYMGFMVDAAIDTTAEGVVTWDAFTSFLEGVITYFDIASPPYIDDVTGPTGTVLAGPYDVSATIVDVDGDAITAVVKYSDDYETWTSVSMTAVVDTFSAQIPDVTEPGTYYWFIEATADGDVTTWPDAIEGPAEFERFVPTADVLVAFNGGSASGYPGAYYFGKGDFATYGVIDFDHDVWEKALSAELLSVYNTVYEITTDGPNWNHSSLITAWLAEGAKNYFLCGDEWFGALSGWVDLDFVAGDFEYDVLGVTHSYNDVNYYYHSGSGAPSPIEAVDGNVLTGALYTAHTAIPDTLLYDPVYEIEVSNWLDAFDILDDGNTFACMTTDTLADATPLVCGVNRTVGDDKVVLLGFDPLSINATPYTWWGFAYESPQSQSLLWFGIPHSVSVDEVTMALPTEFDLSQNYPNPFNPTTNIEFAVPEKADVKIVVYNMLGQKIVDLANKAYQPGHYQVIWNGKDASGCDVSSGVYFYRMTAGDFTKTSKMIFLK
ncbi:MAG: T9SS type A sorting domain-containing protein [Candidatus Marinimicrobia bacterium]|nr:T9SS type A sorting domain-containing protein [Candidatus Neomarinimicrobiota bacterium]